MVAGTPRGGGATVHDARLVEVDVGLDEAGRDQLAAEVEGVGIGTDVRLDGGNRAARNSDVRERRIGVRARDAGAPKHDVQHHRQARATAQASWPASIGASSGPEAGSRCTSVSGNRMNTSQGPVRSSWVSFANRKRPIRDRTVVRSCHLGCDSTSDAPFRAAVERLHIPEEAVDRGIDEMMAVGTPEQCIGSFERLVSLGVTNIEPRPIISSEESCEILSREIIPHFKSDGWWSALPTEPGIRVLARVRI